MDQGSQVQNWQLHPGLCQLVLKSWHLREVTSSLDLPPHWPRAIRTVVLEYCIEVRSGFTLSEGFILFMEQDDTQSSASISQRQSSGKISRGQFQGEAYKPRQPQRAFLEVEPHGYLMSLRGSLGRGGLSKEVRKPMECQLEGGRQFPGQKALGQGVLDGHGLLLVMWTLLKGFCRRESWPRGSPPTYKKNHSPMKHGELTPTPSDFLS